jgi:hypothetical protein
MAPYGQGDELRMSTHCRLILVPQGLTDFRRASFSSLLQAIRTGAAGTALDLVLVHPHNSETKSATFERVASAFIISRSSSSVGMFIAAPQPLQPQSAAATLHCVSATAILKAQAHVLNHHSYLILGSVLFCIECQNLMKMMHKVKAAIRMMQLQAAVLQLLRPSYGDYPRQMSTSILCLSRPW